MLKYDEFCVKVEEEFMNYMSSEFNADNGFFVETKEVAARGKKLKTLYIKCNDASANVPVIPLEPVYQNLFVKKHKGEMVPFLKEIAASYEKNYIKALGNSFKSAVNEDDVQLDVSKIFFTLVNYEANKNEMETNEIPFTQEGELAITYRVLVSQTDDEVKSILLSKSVLKSFEEEGYNFEQIKKAAMENTEKLFPEKLIRISEDAYMLTSEYCGFGSSALLYSNSSIKELSERTGKNVLIFPCSINTCFIVLVDDDIVRETDIYQDEVANYFTEMNEPILNTQVMMYSNKEKKLLYSEDFLFKPRNKRRPR